MRKKIWMAIIAAAALVSGGVVYAHMADGDWGRGMGSGYGPGWCLTGADENVNAENLNQFQKETSALRGDLAGKQAELRNEYRKTTPDLARVSELRKEIFDIRTKIRQSAEKSNVPMRMNGQGRGSMGPGMMYSSASSGCPRW